MATVHRTFINRGKKEVTQLKPNYVYAVEYNLDSETARTLGIRIDQVGLIIVNHYGNITHNYNMAHIGSWAHGSVSLEGKHVWFADTMEIQFATNYIEFVELSKRFNNVRQDLKAVKEQLKYFYLQPLHRFAENVLDIWRETKSILKNGKC